jgi:hypothetical protein
MTEPLDLGPRRCKDCRAAVPPPRMWRCAECLKKRIDRIQRRARAA